MSAARFSLAVAANGRDAATESGDRAGDGAGAGDGTATGTGPATALVTVTGELDATNAAQFVAEVGRVAAERATVLDLSGLLYVDSAGFAALHRVVAEQDVAVVLPQQSPLHRAAVLMDLPHHGTVDEAAAAVAAATG
jgi:anti-anti-sigma factor